jgi:hypothetical protein
MKRTVTKEIDICDICETNEAGYRSRCLACGKSYCYECSKAYAVQMSCGVFHEGSNDGCYCINCYTALEREVQKPVSGMFQDLKPLFLAYWQIKMLREEYNTFWMKFKPRQEAVERHLEMLLRQYRQNRKDKSDEA